MIKEEALKFLANQAPLKFRLDKAELVAFKSKVKKS